MRFLFFCLLIFNFSFKTIAQSWIDVGVKAHFGLNQLYNANIWENNNAVNLLSYGHNFGGKIGYNFNIKYQVTLDFLFSKGSQVYDLSNESNIWERNYTFSYFSLPLLFRFNNESGNYFELGPQVNFISKANMEEFGVTQSVKSQFNPTNYGAVVGMGSYFLGNKNLYLLFGVRLHVGLSDMIGKDGGLNSVDHFPILQNEVNLTHAEYQKTTMFMLMLNTEINFDLGYLARSNCKRSAFMLFK